MNRHAAVQLIAQEISRGEVKQAAKGKLIPTGYVEDYDKIADFNVASDSLSDAYGATHFKRTWEVQGKSVRVVLFSAPEFGDTSVTEDMMVFNEVIQLGE